MSEDEKSRLIASVQKKLLCEALVYLEIYDSLIFSLIFVRVLPMRTIDKYRPNIYFAKRLPLSL